MPPFICDCGCVPGICNGEDCECDSHMIDALTPQQMGDIMVKLSDYDISDVCNKSKNQLFGMCAEVDDLGGEVLKAGCKLLENARRPNLLVCPSPTSDAVLRSILDTPYIQQRRPSTPKPKTSKKPVSKPARKTTKKPIRKPRCVT